jgi:3-oxoacyl-[acyl-carrier-protein] synthase II
MRRVAVTGFGVVSPVGVGREAFWPALAAGRSGIARITHFDCSTFAVQLAGEVKEAVVLPSPAVETAERDPKVGFALAACLEAAAQAGLERLGPGTLLHLGVSLEVFHLEDVIGDGDLDFAGLARRCLSGQAPPLQAPLDTAARLIQEHLGLAGRALTNVSACAAGSQAIGHGFRNVRAGRWEVAVCGGFDSMLNPLGVGGFQLLGALTTENDRGPHACRPFDASRSGTALGEGAAVLVLEPLDKARAAGKEVLAEVCGYGSTLDAHSLSAPDPEGDGAARAMQAALEDAGIAPEQIAHISAHGTGTRLNDEVEAAAIRRVFKDCWARIPVSATKSVLGHLIAAAGAVQAGGCLLSLTRGDLPPNPCLEKVGPGCELDHVTRPGRRLEGEYVLSNSFGFGGQNATLVFRKAKD